eukprot:PhF_6_TR654/c0_g1_i1/m.948
MMRRMVFPSGVGSISLLCCATRWYTPMSGLSGLEFRNRRLSEELKVAAQQREYKSPFWITEGQLKIVGNGKVAVKPGETALATIKPPRRRRGPTPPPPTRNEENNTETGVEDDDGSTTLTVEYYNADQTTDASQIESFASKFGKYFTIEYTPINAVKGALYRGSMRRALQGHAALKEFKSPVWATKEQVAKYYPGVQIKPEEEEKFIAVSFTKLSDNGIDKQVITYNLYNIEQTTNQKAIEDKLDQLKKRALSGLTAKPYAEHCQEPLQKIALEKGYTSIYWVTAQQMAKFTPPLKLKSGEKGVPLQMTDNKTGNKIDVMVYNANQMIDEDAVERHLKIMNGQRVPSIKVFIGGLLETSEEELKELLAPYGVPTKLSLKRGFAFVEFQSKVEAEAAISNLKGTPFGNAPSIHLEMARTREESNKLTACRNHMAGTCKYGENCRYSHDPEIVKKAQEEGAAEGAEEGNSSSDRDQRAQEKAQAVWGRNPGGEESRGGGFQRGGGRGFQRPSNNDGNGGGFQRGGGFQQGGGGFQQGG